MGDSAPDMAVPLPRRRPAAAGRAEGKVAMGPSGL
jgi:hypothetical protein